jgi:hypothetical protein
MTKMFLAEGNDVIVALLLDLMSLSACHFAKATEPRSVDLVCPRLQGAE